MAEVIQSPVRKISFSSDFSDLPPTDDIDERIAKIREAIQKSEVKRQIRRKQFRIRLKQCVKRIETLEEKQVDRLGREGIIISLEKVKAEASTLVQEQRENENRRSQEEYNVRICEIKANSKTESPSQTEVNEWPQNATEKTDDNSAENFSNEKFVFSVKEELAKLNLIGKTKKSKPVANKKEVKNKEPNALPDLKSEKPLRGGGRRGSLQYDVTDIAKVLQRRGSLTMTTAQDGGHITGSGRRKSITMETPDKKYLERRRSSLRTPPEWLQKAPGPETAIKKETKEKKRRR